MRDAASPFGQAWTQQAALKSVAGFLNAKGGTLVVEVADDGKVLGFEADAFTREDMLGFHLVGLVRDRLDEIYLPCVHPLFEDQALAAFLCGALRHGPKACFVKDGSNQCFYPRGGNATAELSGDAVIDYVKARFG